MAIDIKTIGIIGSGQMGKGIADLFDVLPELSSELDKQS